MIEWNALPLVRPFNLRHGIRRNVRKAGDSCRARSEKHPRSDVRSDKIQLFRAS